VKEEEVFRIVVSIVKEQLDYEGEIQLEFSIADDLGADSLDQVELTMALEERFGVNIPDEKAEKIKTISDAVDCIVSGLKT